MESEAKTTILQCQVNAALAGHGLGPSKLVVTPPGGYQAECKKIR